MSCYLCDRLLKNGHRLLKKAEIESDDTSTDDVNVKVCWSQCSATTAMLIELAKRKMDEGDASSRAGASVLRDEPFDLGYLIYDPSRYMEFLESKRNRVVAELSTCGLTLPCVETFPSPPQHFRNRCRLGVHVRYSSIGENIEKVSFLQWDSEGIPNIEVEYFPIVSVLINALLESLKSLLPESPLILCKSLSSIHLLSSLQGQAVITLVYDVDSGLTSKEKEWRDAASTLLEALYSSTEGLERGGCGIVAQSKGMRFIEPSHKDHVMETLSIVSPDAGQLSLKYKFPIDGFSNPNGAVNQLCLGWLSRVVHSLHNGEDHDLLELYCGAANHTCALARYYRKVVCVELNKALCKAAEVNLALNGITNVRVVAGPSEKFANGLLRRKGYLDMTVEPPSQYSFSTVLVDPQRGGLDEVTRELLRHMPRIIYISCNPQSLVRDLAVICQNGADCTKPLFRIEAFAVFDHFAYSAGHLESGVYLVRNDD